VDARRCHRRLVLGLFCARDAAANTPKVLHISAGNVKDIRFLYISTFTGPPKDEANIFISDSFFSAFAKQASVRVDQFPSKGKELIRRVGAIHLDYF
jgi:hypothetical protein